MKCIFPVLREVLHQRCRCVRSVRRIIHVAANNRSVQPVLAPREMFVREVLHHLVNLVNSMSARPVVKVHVHHRQTLSIDLDFREEKAFFTQRFSTEDNVLRFDDGMSREKGVTVVQSKQSVSSIVDSVNSVLETGELAKKSEMIETPRPAGVFIDFLKSDDVGSQLHEELRNLRQIGADFSARGQPLDRLQAATVGNIISHNPQPSHEQKTFDVSSVGCNIERPLMSSTHRESDSTSLGRMVSRFRSVTPARVWEAMGLGILALVAAGAALLFHALTVWIERNTIERFEAMGATWFIIGSLASVVVGSLLASFLIAKFAPTTAGGGVLPVKLAFWKEFGVLTKREAVVKLLASSLTLGSGVSMGPEGPSLQIGAATMSSGAEYFGVAKQNRRAWCAAGAAAGLAAVFNAPLAGITFILEEIIGDLHSKLLGRVVVAAVVGALVAHGVLGPQPAFQTTAVGAIRWQVWLLTPFAAVLAACGGALFQKLALNIRGRLHVRLTNTWSPYRPVIGAVITWLVGISVYSATGHAGVFGIGYGDITSAIAGNLVWTTALALFVGKILATAGAVGTNGCGGIFAPSLFIGASAGACLAGVVQLFFPLAHGEFAMIVMTGMAASLGAVIRAPFTCVLLIFEVTNQWVILPALIVATLLSQLVARMFNRHDMYEETLLQNGVDPNQVLPPRHFKRWREIPVSALASFQPVQAKELDAKSLKALLERSTHERFPVVNAEGKTYGVITRREAELVIAGASTPQIDTVTWIDPRASVGEARKLMLAGSALFLCVGDAATQTLQGIMTVHDLLRGESALEDDGT